MVYTESVNNAYKNANISFCLFKTYSLTAKKFFLRYTFGGKHVEVQSSGYLLLRSSDKVELIPPPHTPHPPLPNPTLPLIGCSYWYTVLSIGSCMHKGVNGNMIEAHITLCKMNF